MFTHTQPMPAEHLHSRKCLAHALICAVENMRDSESSDLDFRIMLQDGLPLQWADEYLASGTADCLCHAWDISDAGGAHGVCACGWEGPHRADSFAAVSDAREHAELAITRAWQLVS